MIGLEQDRLVQGASTRGHGEYMYMGMVHAWVGFFVSTDLKTKTFEQRALAIESARKHRMRRPQCDAPTTPATVSSGCSGRIAVIWGRSARAQTQTQVKQSVADTVDVKVVMVTDGRTAAALVGTGPAVLRSDSAVDPEHCALETRRASTCHSDVCRRQRQADW